jgi:hypothetical protein
MSESSEQILLGARLVSSLSLDELPRWSCRSRGDPLCIEVTRADVPGEYPLRPALLLSCRDGGDCRLQIPCVAHYHISGGSRVTVVPVAGATEADVRLFLLESVLGLIGHQRGFLPLSAACVALGGRAVAICGAHHVGKSTYAAALALRGFQVVADSVTVVSAEAGPPAQVLPTAARLKVWPDSLAALQVPLARSALVRAGQGRYYFEAAARRPEPGQPVPRLASIIVLDRRAPPAPHRISPEETRTALRRAIGYRTYLDCLPERATTYQAVDELAGTVPAYRVAPARKFVGFAEQLEGIVEVLGNE